MTSSAKSSSLSRVGWGLLAAAWGWAAVPALAEPTYFECKRLDAPQTAYLKLDEATQSALILDKPDLLRKTEARPAEDFTFLAVDFEQFYKYRFNRKTSLLTEKKMGVNADYQCQGINPQ